MSGSVLISSCDNLCTGGEELRCIQIPSPKLLLVYDCRLMDNFSNQVMVMKKHIKTFSLWTLIQYYINILYCFLLIKS